MSSFTDPLIIEAADDKERKWKLVKPFRYWLTLDSFNKHIPEGYDPIIVPEGFVTDFASIPRMFWSVLPPFGKYGKAAVVHDFLYKINHVWDKDTADSIFLNAMTVLQVPKVTRTAMYYAVKYFGFHAWNTHRKAERDGK